MVSFGCWGHCRKEWNTPTSKRLFTGTFSASICHLKCYPPAALISAKGLPQLTEDSQADPWSVCLQGLRQSRATIPHFHYTDYEGLTVSSRRSMMDSLECRIQPREEWGAPLLQELHVGLHAGADWWTDASSSQLMTEIQLHQIRGRLSTPLLAKIKYLCLLFH